MKSVKIPFNNWCCFSSSCCCFWSRNCCCWYGCVYWSTLFSLLVVGSGESASVLTTRSSRKVLALERSWRTITDLVGRVRIGTRAGWDKKIHGYNFFEYARLNWLSVFSLFSFDDITRIEYRNRSLSERNLPTIHSRYRAILHLKWTENGPITRPQCTVLLAFHYSNLDFDSKVSYHWLFRFRYRFNWLLFFRRILLGIYDRISSRV